MQRLKLFWVSLYFARLLELRTLIRNSESIDDMSEFAHHDGRKIGEVLSDAVIGDTILRIIVCTNFFTPISRSHLRETGFSEFFHFFLLFHGVDLGSENLNGAHLVLKLTTLDLTLDDQAGRHVDDPDGGTRLVNLLSPGTTRTTRDDIEIFIADIDLHRINLWKNRDRDRARVNPSFIFGLRDTLNSVDSCLIFEPRVCPKSGYLHRDTLESSCVPFRFIEDLKRVSFFFGECDVRISKLTSKQCRLISTRPSTELKDEIFIIIRVFWEQSNFHRFFKFLDTFLGTRYLFFCHLHHIFILLMRKDILRLRMIGIYLFVFAIQIHRLLKRFFLLHEITQTCRIAIHIRIGELVIQVFVLRNKIVEIEFHNFFQ